MQQLDHDTVGPTGAGAILGLSASRVRQLIAEGQLPALRTPLGRLIRREDVENLKRTREQAKWPVVEA